MIRVKYENNVYKGSIYLNNNLNYQVSFAAKELSYFLFCHRDKEKTDCENLYWTSGFYDKIRIYKVDDNDLINDNTVYNTHIYDDVFDYLNYVNQEEPFFPLMLDTIDIPLSLDSLNDNKITIKDNKNNDGVTNQPSDLIPESQSYTNYPTTSSNTKNPDNLQVYNYGDKQDIPYRYPDPSPDPNKYTHYTNPDLEDEICVKGVSCYGEGTPHDPAIVDTDEKPDILFSDECRVCSASNYFRFSNCEDFPENPNSSTNPPYTGYYVLPFPFHTDSGILDSSSDSKTVTINGLKSDR